MNSLLDYSFREHIIGEELFNSILDYHKDYPSYNLSGGDFLTKFQNSFNQSKSLKKKKTSKRKKSLKKKKKILTPKKISTPKRKKRSTTKQETLQSPFKTREIVTQTIDFMGSRQSLFIEKKHKNLNFYFQIPSELSLLVKKTSIHYLLESNVQDVSSIPTGGFSCIVTYQPKENKYQQGIAMKCIDETSLQMFKNNTPEKIQQEIDILREIRDFSKHKKESFLVHFIGDKQEVITRANGESHKIQYILMEKMDHDVSHLLRLPQAKLSIILTISNFKKATKQIYQGLEALHKNGIVHNDMKPGNILYSYQNQQISIRLTDFNGSFHLKPTGKPESKTTGTLGYNSPEKTFHEKNITEKTDIWTTALILYQFINCCKIETEPNKQANEIKIKGSSPVIYFARKYKKQFCHIKDKILCKKKQINYLLSQDLPKLIKRLQDDTGFLETIRDKNSYQEILKNSLGRNMKKRWSATRILKEPLFSNV